jgi:galactokinase
MMAQTVRYAAPGRINLIGEHTDYNLGWALPIALPERTVVAFTPDRSEVITVRSNRGEGGWLQFPLRTGPGQVTGWAGYVAGVVWALRTAGHPVPGGTMSITSDVEMGSGLGSSAALECAVLGALMSAAGVPIDRTEQARLAQRAENDYVGAPTGLLDQLASLFGAAATALLIDFRELTVEPVGFDPSPSGVALLLIDSRARHEHVSGEYAARRAACERAATDLGVSSLRDVQDRGREALDVVSDQLAVRRARHVLTENSRVMDFVAALGDSDFIEAGRIMTVSHVSMRNDFEITNDHIDLIADTAVRAGAYGARMTGGGFGGCVIALVPDGRANAVAEQLRQQVPAAGHPRPVVIRTHAAQGAGPVQ